MLCVELLIKYAFPKILNNLAHFGVYSRKIQQKVVDLWANI